MNRHMRTKRFHNSKPKRQGGSKGAKVDKKLIGNISNRGPAPAQETER
jgi:hypothetical protein